MSVDGVQKAALSDELAEFCRTQHRTLVGALGLYSGDAAVAEELAQETLLRVCRSWEHVRTCDSPAAWTMRVALNLARSRFRRVATGWRAMATLAARPVSDPAEPTDVLAVRTAVRALPDRQRRALVLRYYADMSVRETATLLGCPEGTVKTLTRQAIASLRRAGLEVDDDD